jgi:hypothetical protein
MRNVKNKAKKQVKNLNQLYITSANHYYHHYPIFKLLKEQAFHIHRTFIHSYHFRFIPKGIADTSHKFLRDTYILTEYIQNNT